MLIVDADFDLTLLVTLAISFNFPRGAFFGVRIDPIGPLSNFLSSQLSNLQYNSQAITLCSVLASRLIVTMLSLIS